MTEGLHRLSVLLEEYGDEKTLEIISSFSCSRDKDLESFLHKKAIPQDKKNISRTYVLIDDVDGMKIVIGYFTLALKCMTIHDGLALSNALKKRMNVNNGVAQSYLIGQLSRADGCQKGKGRKMIEQAIQIFQKGKSLFGCCLVRLDCKDDLVSYYKDAGFECIGKNKEGNLNQMIIIL